MNDETNTVTTGLSFPGSYGPIADFLGFELDVGEALLHKWSSRIHCMNPV